MGFFLNRKIEKQNKFFKKGEKTKRRKNKKKTGEVVGRTDRQRRRWSRPRWLCRPQCSGVRCGACGVWGPYRGVLRKRVAREPRRSYVPGRSNTTQRLPCNKSSENRQMDFAIQSNSQEPFLLSTSINPIKTPTDILKEPLSHSSTSYWSHTFLHFNISVKLRALDFSKRKRGVCCAKTWPVQDVSINWWVGGVWTQRNRRSKDSKEKTRKRRERERTR